MPVPAAESSLSKSNAAAFIDPAALMRIKSLQVRARIIVQGFLRGLHRSPNHGFSVEFSEYRQYSPGDDPKYLDWRLYARTDRYFLKRFEEETNLRCHLLLDLSRSMGFGTLAYTKADYARSAAATLAYFLAMQRDAVGLLTFSDSVVDYLPARFRPGHLQRMMAALERSVTGTGTDLVAPLEQVARTVRKRSLLVLISDLLASAEDLVAQLQLLRSQGHEVVVFRVLDPAEVAFSFDMASNFVDLETGRHLYIDPAAARDNYRENFSRHANQIEQACATLGMDVYTFLTSQPLDLALFDFVQSRSRGRKVGGRP
ncbi:MAG: DUF58 domain-containing protein [Tepidisphaeraceae bacterium]